MPESSIFAVLPPGRVTWAVGAVHGEGSRLAELHRHLNDRIAPEDNLVYLGNFVGRGTEVRETIHELLVFRRSLMARQTFEGAGAIVYLRGRQEEMWHKLLQVQFAPNPRQVLEWMLAQGIGATLEAYGGSIPEARRAAATGAAAMSQWTNRLRATMRGRDGHDRLMAEIRRAAFTSDRTLLFVSSGIEPSRPLSQQADAFWWGGRNFDTLEQAFDGFERVVRGFDPSHGGVWFKDYSASLDGGCGFGGLLVAASFDASSRLIDTIEV